MEQPRFPDKGDSDSAPLGQAQLIQLIDEADHLPRVSSQSDGAVTDNLLRQVKPSQITAQGEQLSNLVFVKTWYLENWQTAQPRA
jgi:hypothetical protein